MSSLAEAPNFLQVYSDGSVKRFAPKTVSPSFESSSNGYKFKDVIIDPTKPITGRLFLPDSHHEKLPILVYFHGGGFCIGSTTWLGYHHFLGDLCVASKSIVLLVDYRLAPKYHLPTAYGDCYTSLEWLVAQVTNEILLGAQVTCEPWPQKADLSRVFISGTVLEERGVMYAEFMKKNGVKEVKLVEAKEEKHVFHVFYPESDATRLLQSQMSHFIRKY